MSSEGIRRFYSVSAARNYLLMCIRIRKSRRDKPQIANRLPSHDSFVKLILSLALIHACDQQSCFPAW